MRLINSLDLIEALEIWDKKTGQYIPFKLWPIQKNWLQIIHTKKQALSVKKRQVGWSQLTGADSLVQCMANQNYTVLVLSISADDAKVFLDRIREMYNRIPTPGIAIKQGQHRKSLAILKAVNRVTKGREAGEEMVFASGSSIVSLSAQKGRGRTADRVILDEMAFYTLRNSKIELEDVLRSIGPTLDRAGGQLIGISTANGLNSFYRLYLDAQHGKNNFTPFFVCCYDDPDFTKDQRKQLIKDHGKDHVNQEYPETWQQAFLSSGLPRFNLEILSGYRDTAIEPVFIGGIATQQFDDAVQKYTYIKEWIIKDGSINFYKYYINDAIYVITADVAEGLDQGDYSCAKVFELETGCQVAEWHGHCEPAELGDLLTLMGIHYNNALIAPEANNHGISTIQRLRDNGYINIFQGQHVRPRSDDKYLHPGKRFGWLTTNISKKAMIDNLAQLILDKAIPYFTKEDLEELSTDRKSVV